ncbi:hypothetical protein WILDE_91 [Arthrobacter phage Wilde]|uniref:Uncharacterized protein n=1 Tax=Arthrobacter phage Wilde TaxID=1772323 RepID=A0A0U3TNZ4_9CAUD|nr:hypothetical protein WILDE_91 [Arthrobacter phage Wilde]
MPVHFITSPAEVYAVCGDRGHQSTDPARVTCFICRKSEAFLKAQRGMPMVLADVLADGTTHLDWGMQVARCGTKNGKLSVLIEKVTCPLCIDLNRPASERIAERVGQPTHVPPILNEKDDNLWLFHDRMESDVELIVQNAERGHAVLVLNGETFHLHHLDRLDLVRALLHDLHYSPEVGGPHD